MNRRIFISGALSCLGAGAVYANTKRSAQRVTLLHTNDTHSRIDPFERGPFKGLGGITKRATLIAELRRKHPATLVVDAGDIFQGTPYFNMFQGRVELKAMSLAGYDISAIGNHDFDLGADWFLNMAQKHAKFPFVCANLIFSQPLAKRIVHPYIIREINGWRIGFFGLGVRFQGLVAEKLHKGVRYIDPIPVAKKLTTELRQKHKCDAVVLLSHLGYWGFDREPGDIDLALKVPGIDVIIGGHTHTFLYEPSVVRAPDGRNTKIYQVGHSGIFLGQIDLDFDPIHGLQVNQALHPVKL